MTTWSGRRALVTGASGGIGRAVAVALAREGCALALAGRDEAALAETAAQCSESPLAAAADGAVAPAGLVASAATAAALAADRSEVAASTARIGRDGPASRETASPPAGSTARVGRDRPALREAAAPRAAQPLLVVADVTDPLADGVFAGVLDAFGGSLDLLVNVAGSPGRAALLVELDDASFEEAYALHVVAPARLMRLCHGALARAGGAVVNIGSIAAHAAVPRGAAYSAAKAALVALTQAAAVEWARDGIRANVIEPGYVATGFNAPLIDAGLEPRLLAKIPGGRAVTPEAIARAVLYAGSPDNRELNGAVLRVDGGQMARL